MIAQIRAELLKLRTTRTTIALILAMIALILLFTLLDGLLTHPGGLASRQDQRQLLSVSSFTAVFAALAGVLLVTSEYRYGTIRPTTLFNPARSCGARSAPTSERSSTTRSAQSSRFSPGASSSTTSCSASPHRSGGSPQPAPRTHSWACESIISCRQAPARSP